MAQDFQQSATNVLAQTKHHQDSGPPEMNSQTSMRTQWVLRDIENQLKSNDGISLAHINMALTINFVEESFQFWWHF